MATHVMNLFSNSTTLIAAKTVTVASIGLFAGVALSYNAVIMPALKATSNKNALSVWSNSCRTAKNLQVGLILTSLIGGSTVYYKTENPYFLTGALLMVLNIPFTFAFIMPINKTLLNIQQSGKGEESINVLFGRWDILHFGRTLISSIALGLTVWGSYSGKSVTLY
ncbi:hypothetical protein BG011_004838 [Mortierella polycephala]|uniref:DUF1772-domain-containing protein n=1 Tax=Mortierella polycephala TaxID=41804 RepID=A0A9P6PX93_9FUNG|nr:hypothetical protein BG011_004838 [Mortierella polycephala]